MAFMDYVDEYVLGPLNLLDTLEGLLRGLAYADLGYKFTIPRADKDGEFTLNEVRALLKSYGIDTFWFGFDAQNMSFRVKRRQARWAEYILLHAGVELRNPTFDQRNPGYAASHAPGWMPKPWSHRESRQTPPDGSGTEEAGLFSGLDSWIDRLLGL